MPITRRETDVLRAIGRRLTNDEIAAALFVSVRTVESHVASLRRKLAASDRSQLIAVAQGDARREAEAVTPPNSFVGRDHDVELIERRIGAERMLVLVGPAGIGKSRLARTVAGRFSGETRVVDLSDVPPADVARAVADGLGVGSAAGTDLLGQLRLAVSDRTILVVLDNADRVIETVVDVASLIVANGAARALVTSRRRPAGPSAGAVHVVAPLPVPAETDLDAVRQSPAAVLMIDRAIAARPDFGVDERNAGAVASLCRRLDGLPLAIELAAPHLASMSADELDRALADHIGLLDPPHAGDRQRSLSAAVEWSLSQLDDGEATSLDAACCTGAPKSLEELRSIVASAGARAGESPDVARAVVGLCNQSLLQPILQVDRPTTYGVLETIRSIIRARSRPDQQARLRQAHATFHLEGLRRSVERSLAGEAWTYASGPEREAVLDALTWAAANDPDTAAHLLVGIARRYELAPKLGVLDVSSRVLREHALPEGWATEPLAWAAALINYVDLDLMRQCAEAAADRAATDTERAFGAWAMGCALGLGGHPQQAEPHLRRASDGFQRAGDDRMLGMCAFVAGKIAPDHHVAIRSLEGALQHFAWAGDQWHVNSVRIVLARRSIQAGERLDDVSRWLDDCEAFAASDPDALRLDHAHALASRAELASMDGPAEHATQLSLDAAQLFERNGDLRCLSKALLLAARTGDDPCLSLHRARRAVSAAVLQADPTAQREAVEAVIEHATAAHERRIADQARGALRRLMEGGKATAAVGSANSDQLEGYARGPALVATSNDPMPAEPR